MARSLLCNRESGTARDSPTTSNSDNEIKRQRHKLDSVAAATSTTTAVDTELNGKKKTTTAVAASIVAIRNQNPGKRGQTRECADNKVTRLARKFSSVCLKKEEPENRWRGQQPQPGSRPLSAHGLGGGKRLVNRTTTCSVAARTNTKIGTEEKMEEDDDAACRVRKTIRMFEIDSNRVKMKALRGSNSDVHATKANENGHYATAKDIDGNQLVLARNRLKPLVNVEQEKENPSWTSTSTVPVVFSKGDACARSDAYTTEALTENQASVDVRRRCFSMFAKQTQTYASFDVKTLKNRPLSVARPFCLEHASQDAPSPLPPPPMSSEERQTYSSADHLAAASATATAFNCETVDDGHVNVAKTTVPSTLISPPPLNKNSSFLHRSKDYSSRVLPVSADASASVRARYEHLFDTNGDAADAAAATATDDDSDNDYGYSNIYDNDVEFDGCYHLHSSNSDSTNNVYDTVLYSELNTRVEKRKEGDRDYDYDHGDRVEDGDDDDDGDDEAAYEVVSSLSRVNGQTDDSISNSSNSSLEKANSLYETKENESTDLTDLPTVTATAIVISNATSASVVSDDWLDIDIFERESADETGRGKIVFTKKRRMRIGAGKLKKIRRKKFRSHQNQRQSKNAVAQTQAVTTEYEIEKASAVDDNLAEEICDDFDDTSSEENDYANKSRRSSPLVSRASERSFLPNVNVHVQSQNIYEFMKKARKTMRKSWSSFNQQMRKSSTNNRPTVVGAVGLVNADKVSASASASASAPVKMRNNSCGSVDGCGAISSGGGSVRWTSFKTKLRPKYGTVSGANSSSIFYVNPEDLRFDRDERVSSRADVKYEKSSVGRRKTIYLEVNPSIPRPSSPPPPPPATAGAATDEDSGNLNGNGNDSGNGNGNGNGNDNSNDNDGRNDTRVLTDANYISNSPLSSSNSDFNLSSCSDLRLRFADEPLYQFYAESVAQLTTNASMLSERYSNDSSDGYEEIGSSTSRPSAMELITPSPNGHGQCRSLWCEVDEVKNSGILEKLSISRQKLQEAKFEVITSEASYYKSLSVLDRIFVNDTRLRDEKLLCKNDWKILFGNVAAVRKCSQLVLSDLEKCWQEDIMLSDLGNVVLEHASTNFKIFVKYCSNQIYIDRTLRKLREQNVNFVELISKLEADPVCQSLSLHSFLMLPMQRITRMPLLVDAILSKLEPIDDQDHSHLTTFKTTLAILNKIVKDCNESARKFERYEEMLLLSRQLEFSRKDVKMFSVASSSRWLVRSGPLLHLNPPDAKLTITRKLTKSATKLYFFLFNDVLVIAKKKSDDSYAVVDYCLRNVMQMNSVEDAIAPAQPSLSSSSSSSLSLSLSPSPSPSLVSLYSPHRYLLILTMLENHEGKTVEMVLSCDSDSTRQRWLEASYSRLTSDNPEEKLYEEWDCPQVLAVHDYLANQPDELSLLNGDVVKVLKKTTDGWYHGERIRDGIIGWFPGNYTIEIASQHTRAKNLKLRHRLLALSADYLQHHLQQK